MTKETIEGLEPKLLWGHFYRISRIPRPSKGEGRIRDYVIEVAQRNGLEYRRDSIGNVVVKKPALPQLRGRPPMVLQSHLDMVCEKNRETDHDFQKDPIRLNQVNHDWVAAEGTTLGADNGIGVAAMLTVMESPSFRHGPLELLFTVDEETGLTGAREISRDMLEGRVLLNLDSVEDDAVCIGCAGGKNTDLLVQAETEEVPTGYKAVRVRVGGLLGGHSGLDIHEGRANAIKLLARFLSRVGPESGLRIVSCEGGSKLNAIPREAEAVILLLPDKIQPLRRAASDFQGTFREEFAMTDPQVSLTVEEIEVPAPSHAFTSEFQSKFLNLLLAIPHGVIAMSLAMPGLVQTSTNLALVTRKGDKINIGIKQRSSIESELMAISDAIEACGHLAGAEIYLYGEYPPWTPSLDSVTLNLVKTVYHELFGEEPKIKAIHAGVECALLGDTFPGMDMVSIGSTVINAHSPDERVLVPSVAKHWKLITAVLDKIGA